MEKEGVRYDPATHHRRSLRLKGYDYSQEGAYFITICAHSRRDCLFGEIVRDEMILNECGTIVRDEWLKTSEIRSEIHLGEYVIMPNHFHGIVIIVMHNPVGAYGHTPLQHTPLRSPSHTIGAMIRGFKSGVTKGINAMRQTPGRPVRQRNYYEHIIRSEADYSRIAEYIVNNPRQWPQDSLHPDMIRPIGDKKIAFKNKRYCKAGA
ncbi:MAG: hypothetical protein WC291_01955 [Thermodesulfovibrionales bacterium]|jgi:REP element-mobilizing transposase RayT